jgi:CheY-like chemotaxis protein
MLSVQRSAGWEKRMGTNSILVVDDERLMLDAMVEMLSFDGFEVTGVLCANEALDELYKKEFKLLIADVIMPKMSGIELIAKVHEKWPDLETVVISGHGSEATRNQLEMMGVFGYLDKPVKPVDLISVAREGARSNRLDRLAYRKAEPKVKMSQAPRFRPFCKHSWMRFLRLAIFDFLSIVLLSLLVGAATAYLCGGFKSTNSSDENSTTDKTDLIQKYKQYTNDEDLKELQTRYGKSRK